MSIIKFNDTSLSLTTESLSYTLDNGYSLQTNPKIEPVTI